MNNGSFQVPLFKGTVPPVILGAADVYEKIREQLKGNASLPKSAAKPVELSNEGKDGGGWGSQGSGPPKTVSDVLVGARACLDGIRCQPVCPTGRHAAG